MAKQGFRVVDSDIHVAEPADLWERYLEPQFKDRGPRPSPVDYGEFGRLVVTARGLNSGYNEQPQRQRTRTGRPGVRRPPAYPGWQMSTTHSSS